MRKEFNAEQHPPVSPKGARYIDEQGKIRMAKEDNDSVQCHEF